MTRTVRHIKVTDTNIGKKLHNLEHIFRNRNNPKSLRIDAQKEYVKLLRRGNE